MSIHFEPPKKKKKRGEGGGGGCVGVFFFFFFFWMKGGGKEKKGHKKALDNYVCRGVLTTYRPLHGCLRLQGRLDNIRLEKSLSWAIGRIGQGVS